MPPDHLAAHGEGIEVEGDTIADMQCRFSHALGFLRLARRNLRHRGAGMAGAEFLSNEDHRESETDNGGERP